MMVGISEMMMTEDADRVRVSMSRRCVSKVLCPPKRKRVEKMYVEFLCSPKRKLFEKVICREDVFRVIVLAQEEACREGV
jgi:hypothetical protein